MGECECVYVRKRDREREREGEGERERERVCVCVCVCVCLCVWEEGRSAFKILTGTPTGKRPLGRHSSRWENNIGMHLKRVSIPVIELIRLRIGIIGEHL